jgi:type II secretory pathway component PulJ
MTGSVLAETIDASASSVETNFEIESDEDRSVIESVLRNARNGCWARQMVTKPIPFEDTVTLNGVTIEL